MSDPYESDRDMCDRYEERINELVVSRDSLLAVLRRCVEQGENVVQTWQTVPLHNHHMGIAITGLDMAVIAAREYLEEVKP